MSVGNVRIPFVDSKSFSSEEAETQDLEVRSALTARTPFVSVYESAEGESAFEDPIREAYSSLVDELYDEEFDEALFELFTDVRNMHQDQLASGNPASEADRIVTQHVSQLVRESEAMVDAVGRELGSRDTTGMTQNEFETFFDEYSASAQIDPIVRELLRKAAEKSCQGGGQGAKGIAKVGLGPILNKMKALLNNVLQNAIGKLPEPVRPAAQKLAERLGFAAPKPADPPTSAPAGQTSAAGDASILRKAPRRQRRTPREVTLPQRKRNSIRGSPTPVRAFPERHRADGRQDLKARFGHDRRCRRVHSARTHR
jgi:hypothetical protein